MHKQIVQLCKRTAFVCILNKEYILEKNFLTITSWGFKWVQYSGSVLSIVHMHSVYAVVLQQVISLCF